MSRTNKVVLLAVVIAILLIGVGYAAIQNVTLNISGTAAADPTQSNFKVTFTGTPEVSNSTYAIATIVNDTNASINVSGLTSAGDSVTATYTVQNVSTDLSTDLSVATTNSNTEYFKISSKLAKTSLTAGEATTVTVTVELTKTPISESVSSNIGVELVATPTQPGEEGSSGSTNDYSETPKELTLADITNSNIGDYVDLGGTSWVGTDATSDDWRVFSTEDDSVIVILSTALPNTSQHNTSLRGATSNPNGFYSTSATEMINTLSNSQYWVDFTNNITGAVAYGGLSLSELMTATEENVGHEFEDGFETSGGSIDAGGPMINYDTYLLYYNNGAAGTFCLREGNAANNKMWEVMGGSYSAIFSLGQQYLNSSAGVIIRPIVKLPKTTKVRQVDGVWKIVK